MNFYWKIGLAVALVLMAAFAVLLLVPGGDEREIEKRIEDAVGAAQKGDAEKVVDCISDECRDHDEVCATIRRFVGPRRYEDLQIRDLEVSVSGDSASARFVVRIVRPSELPIPHFERKVELAFRKEAGGWKVTSARAEPAQ